MSDQSINERFRLFRESVGAKRSEIAELLDRTYQTVKDIEDGKSDIRVEHIKKLSEKYQLNPGWLITGEGSQLLIQGTASGQRNEEVSEQLDALCKVLPDNQKHLCETLKKAFFELMKENEVVRAKNAKILKDLQDLLKKI